MKLSLVLLCLAIMLPASFAGALEQSQGVTSVAETGWRRSVDFL